MLGKNQNWSHDYIPRRCPLARGYLLPSCRILFTLLFHITWNISWRTHTPTKTFSHFDLLINELTHLPPETSCNEEVRVCVGRDTRSWLPTLWRPILSCCLFANSSAGGHRRTWGLEVERHQRIWKTPKRSWPVSECSAHSGLCPVATFPGSWAWCSVCSVLTLTGHDALWPDLEP